MQAQLHILAKRKSFQSIFAHLIKATTRSIKLRNQIRVSISTTCENSILLKVYSSFFCRLARRRRFQSHSEHRRANYHPIKSPKMFHRKPEGAFKRKYLSLNAHLIKCIFNINFPRDDGMLWSWQKVFHEALIGRLHPFLSIDNTETIEGKWQNFHNASRVLVCETYRLRGGESRIA